MRSEELNEEDIARRVRAAERQQLAFYLHDSIGQVLVLAKLQLARIQDTLRDPIDRRRQAWLQTTVASLIPEIDNVVQVVQDAAFTLNETVLTEVGLPAALEQECRVFHRRTGIPCDGRFDAVDLDAERGGLVVLIVREALSNAARHSSATNAEVTLEHAGQCGIVQVQDDGRGMEPSHMNAIASLGLRGMEERARALGGILTLDSSPKKGTRITLSFPLHIRPQNTSLPG